MKTPAPHKSFFIISCIAFTFLSVQAAMGKTLVRTGDFHICKNPIIATKENLAKAKALCRQGRTIRVCGIIDQSAFSEGELNKYGWKIICRKGDVVTLLGKETTAPYLSALQGICWVQKYHKFPIPTLCLDTARKMMNVDKINGIRHDLPTGFNHAYRGKNVLIGIIDIEFDTRHPAFLDAQKKTRFIALWDQDTNVAIRKDYSYGRIKKGPELDIDTAFGLIEGTGHGTGMISLAAGSDTTLPFYGIAPEAMLIGVKYRDETVQQDVMNGLHWIFHYADSLNLPCVVNMSIGISEGPHDGTSAVDRAIETLSTPGHIVIGAIGNDGDKNAHIAFSLANGEQKSTWMAPQIDSLQNPPRAQSFSGAEIWGEGGKNMSVILNILDDRNKNYRSSIDTVTTQRIQPHYYLDTVYLDNSIDHTIDTLVFIIEEERSNELNKKPHIYVVCWSNNPHLSMGITVSLTNNDASATVHAWNLWKKAFTGYGISGFLDGDNSSSLDEIGGTGKSTITVGGYINKSRIVTYNDSIFDKKTEKDIGNLIAFSGMGPSIDNRIKPDITAPGDMVIGAMSRRDPYNWQTSIWPDTHSTAGRYVRLTGTSVSSPLVAGVVALMLEAHPRLTVDSVKMLINSTAIKDKFTGDLTTADNRWGSGKINAYGALGKLLGIPVIGTIKENRHEGSPGMRIIYNDARRCIVIEGRADRPIGFQKLVLIHCDGRMIMNSEVKSYSVPLYPHTLARGVYIANLLSNGKIKLRQKLMVW